MPFVFGYLIDFLSFSIGNPALLDNMAADLQAREWKRFPTAPITVDSDLVWNSSLEKLTQRKQTLSLNARPIWMFAVKF